MNSREEKLKSFDRLLTIMEDLREQCPWDKKQTLESIRHLTLEEVYELSDAIMAKDYTEIKKELGDVLLHIVFYSRIASETDRFDIADVCNAICEKLIHRHPHIYGNVKATDAKTVKENWEKIKLAEKEQAGEKKQLLSGVPNSMPSLVKALRIQEKVAQVGFDWPNDTLVLDKIAEEIQEFKKAKTKEEKEDEFGDILFALVNYARHNEINADNAMQKTLKKFTKRFNYIEEQSIEKGTYLDKMTLDEMEDLWVEAKKFD